MASSEQSEAGSVSLVVRRIIRASAERLFDAWTTPHELIQWWGPAGVHCPEAEVDLRSGGKYRIANHLADGQVLWISGEFEVVSRPRRLVYTWKLESSDEAPSRVTVRFEPRAHATEVIVIHEHIESEAKRNEHERGWMGCIDGLVEHLEH